jgi:hypothetical protein
MAFRLSTALRNALLEREALVGNLTIHANTLTFGDGDGAGGNDTITDLSSGLISHKPGDKITIAGSTLNNGTYEILTTTVNVIEVAGASFSAETADAVTVALASCRGGSFNDIFRNGIMRIFSGAQPTTADDVETGTLLVEISVGGGTFVSGQPAYGLNFGETAVSAILAKAPGETWQGEAGASSTAGYFRFYPNDVDNHIGADGGGETKVRFDGAIATAGAQLNMSSTTITSGGTTSIDSVAVTLPTA